MAQSGYHPDLRRRGSAGRASLAKRFRVIQTVRWEPAALLDPGSRRNETQEGRSCCDGPANGIAFDWSLARSDGREAYRRRRARRLERRRGDSLVKPWGVDASSRLESSPGVKDHEKVRRFVEAALKA